MLRLPSRLLLLFAHTAVAGLALHCGDEVDTPADSGSSDTGVVPFDSGTLPQDTGIIPDSGVVPDSGIRPDTGILPDTGTPDSGTPDSGDDGNNSFATAEAVTLNVGVALTRVIEPAGDRDFFTVDVPADSWLAITTSGGVCDTVVRVYDSAMTQIAENDDGNPGVNTNSEIIYYVQAAGRYFVEVLEYSDWAGDPPEGGSTYRYQIRANTIDAVAQTNVVIDPETGDTEASAVPLEMPNNGGILLGRFDGPTDVDWYRLTMPPGANLRFLGELIAFGPTGYGSTSPIGRVDLLTSSSTIPIGRVNQSLMNTQISAPLASGDYLFSLSHPGTALGANDFYVVKLNIGTDSLVEIDEPGNDVIGGAETVTLVDNGAGIRRAFHISTLLDGDVDYYSFDVLAGEVISVFCGAANSGSGILGFSAEVRSGVDAVLTSAAEAPPATGLVIADFVPPAVGTYFVRLSKSGQSNDVTGQWARCQFRAAPPP